nr:pectate lyase [uncultured bacterium]
MAKAIGGPLPPAPGQGSPVTWATILRQPSPWYASADAKAVAETVRASQRATGGWPKNTDWTALQSDAERQALRNARAETDSTIDNGATVTELRFLTRVYVATRDELLREAVLRGLDYLLASQYSNGGWPQYFPLRTDYSRDITFNDDAMTGVVLLLKDAADGSAGFEFVDKARRDRAAAAVTRAIAVILRTQIRVNGTLTGWCQQYDADALTPARGRSYEHPSIASRETVGIARLLMGVPNPSPEIVAAVDAAAAWLGKSELKGVPEATAPGLWARFYDIATNRPIYSGRDGVIKYRLDEIELERRTGYSWVGPYAAAFLTTEYPKWRAAR